MSEDVMPDSVQLQWEGGGFEARDIPYGYSQYGDLTYFSKDEPGWLFYSTPDQLNTPEIRGYRGIYQFSLLVAGDGTEPDIRKINVDYDGNWHNARPYDA